MATRRWVATAVPFGELASEARLETPPSQHALTLLDRNATLCSVMLLTVPNSVGKSALVCRRLSRLDRQLPRVGSIHHSTKG